VRKYQVVDVSEAQLEDMVRQSPDLIEDGLAFVDHQAATERGPLDVLLVDSGNALAVAELKVVEDDSMLVQGIDYYDYLSRNLDRYARAYKKHKIDPTQEPRLILIAPSFSVNLLGRIKWLNLPVSLYTYQCIRLDGASDIMPVYREVSPPGAPERIEAYSLEDRFTYITDPAVQKLARALVTEMQGWDPKNLHADPIKYSVSIKVGGRLLAYLEPRRKYFHISMYDEDRDWASWEISTAKDVDKVRRIIRMNYDKLKGEDT